MYIRYSIVAVQTRDTLQRPLSAATHMARRIKKARKGTEVVGTNGVTANAMFF